MPAPTAAGNDLSGDHPVFDLAPHARSGAIEALDRGETHYADVPGLSALREEIARALAAWGVNVDAAGGVIITAGEQEARFLAVQMLARAGYHMLLPAVVHPGVRKAAALGGVSATHVPVDPSALMPDVESVRRAMAAGQTALYLESPNRLTGKVMHRRLVEAIAEEALRSNGIIVWDATLVPWIPDGVDYTLIGALPRMHEHAVTIGSLWPGAGLEGWLAAYMTGPATLLSDAQNLKQILAICTTTPAQWGAMGALKAGDAGHRERVMLLLNHKTNAVREYPSGALHGEAASVLAVRFPRSVDLSRLPARPMRGDAFGAPDILRFTVTPTGEVVGAMRSLAALHPDRPGTRP
ncbi:MAG: aminotransferase class I/II-fold pyridoxal phosphate-dependent enzyme [bacterium]